MSDGTDALIAEARRWVGTPYARAQAVRGRGCDCVGLIAAMWAWRTGRPVPELPAYTDDFSAVGANCGISDAASRFLDAGPPTPEPGCVVAFRWGAHDHVAHVGLMTTAARMVHAWGGRGVVETTLWRDRVAAIWRLPD